MPESEANPLWDKMGALLISIGRDNYIQSYSISVVPECLKKPNHDVYMPRKVSIGPRFNDSRDELLLMEEVKLRCMVSLLHRGIDAYTSFNNCMSAVLKLVSDVRASYVVEIKLTEAKLAHMMLLDGCFLLELLISNSEKYDSQFESRFPGPAAEVLKDEDVLSDLMLFENQIPILVLHKLSQTLFPEVFEPDVEELEKEKEEKMKRQQRAKLINNLALSVLGYSSLELPSFNSPHFLELVHLFVNRTFEMIGLVSRDNHNIPMPDTNHENLKLKSCALRLRAAGVNIQVIGDENKRISCLGLIRDCIGLFTRLINLILKTTKQVDIVVAAEEMKGLDFEFKFNKKNGKLEIAKLHITKTTKAKWRNVIAWEHHKSNGKSPRGKFTSSALIFDGLICCDADLKFLKKKNIIVDHMNMSTEELKEFFRTMPLGVDPGVVDSTYVTMVNELNDYSSKPFFSGFFKLLCHLLMIRLEWLVKFLKRNYNFVAVFILIFGYVRFFRSDIVPLIKYIGKSWTNKKLCI
jgi:hypothetical protein